MSARGPFPARRSVGALASVLHFALPSPTAHVSAFAPVAVLACVSADPSHVARSIRTQALTVPNHFTRIANGEPETRTLTAEWWTSELTDDLALASRERINYCLEDMESEHVAVEGSGGSWVDTGEVERATLNGVDENCDGLVDGFVVPQDRDGDGVPLHQDCDDSRAAVSPGGDEERGDGIDNDCDGVVDETEYLLPNGPCEAFNPFAPLCAHWDIRPEGEGSGQEAAEGECCAEALECYREHCVGAGRACQCIWCGDGACRRSEAGAGQCAAASGQCDTDCHAYICPSP